jgi:hypothetical protein
VIYLSVLAIPCGRLRKFFNCETDCIYNIHGMCDCRGVKSGQFAVGSSQFFEIVTVSVVAIPRGRLRKFFKSKSYGKGVLDPPNRDPDSYRDRIDH